MLRINLSELDIKESTLVTYVNDLEREIEEHKQTVGVPAPRHHKDIVNDIVLNHGGKFEVIDDTPKEVVLTREEKLLQIDLETTALIKDWCFKRGDCEEKYLRLGISDPNNPLFVEYQIAVADILAMQREKKNGLL